MGDGCLCVFVCVESESLFRLVSISVEQDGVGVLCICSGNGGVSMPGALYCTACGTALYSTSSFVLLGIWSLSPPTVEPLPPNIQ